jgi:opacity protein-like surface antigen
MSSKAKASRWSLAWSLMAGVGIQIRERTTLDLGYPLSRQGQGGVRRLRQSGLHQPAGRIHDLAAHEFKVGLSFRLWRRTLLRGDEVGGA